VYLSTVTYCIFGALYVLYSNGFYGTSCVPVRKFTYLDIHLHFNTCKLGMPNTFSKPLTDYYSTLPRIERGILQNNKNISDYVHRKELERLDAEKRREERLKQKVRDNEMQRMQS